MIIVLNWLAMANRGIARAIPNCYKQQGNWRSVLYVWARKYDRDVVQPF